MVFDESLLNHTVVCQSAQLTTSWGKCEMWGLKLRGHTQNQFCYYIAISQSSDLRKYTVHITHLTHESYDSIILMHPISLDCHWRKEDKAKTESPEWEELSSPLNSINIQFFSYKQQIPGKHPIQQCVCSSFNMFQYVFTCSYWGHRSLTRFSNLG